MKKILIVGFACLSLAAVGQTQGTGAAASKNAKATAARDAASGQASGKRASSDREASVPSVSEAVVKAPSGGKGRVATGDVNGDGRPDLAATSGSSNGKGQNAAINNSHSNTNNAREAASGQASGKRQHNPLTVRKQIDVATPKLR